MNFNSKLLSLTEAFVKLTEEKGLQTVSAI